MPSYETTIIRLDENDNEIEYCLGIEYSYSKPCKGSKDSFSCPIEPDFPGEVEIEKVIDTETDKIFELTSKEEDDMYEKLNDVVSNY